MRRPPPPTPSPRPTRPLPVRRLSSLAGERDDDEARQAAQA
jgi:hypothetical protein